MMKSVTQSNRRYEVEFEVNKRKQTERVKKKKKTRKKRITKEMKEALALQSLNLIISSCDDEIQKLKNKL